MDIPVAMLLPKKVPKQSRSAILVYSVLDTCEAMLLEGWSPQSSLAPLVERVGIFNSSLYQYFHTKEGIILATYEYMFKKVLARTDMSLEERNAEIARRHRLLRRLDEPFYLFWMDLRQNDATFREFFVEKGVQSKISRYCQMLGFWGDADRVTPESVVCNLPMNNEAKACRLGFTKPLQMQTGYAAAMAG